MRASTGLNWPVEREREREREREVVGRGVGRVK